MSNTKQYMAIDQYGHIYHGLKRPRKDLCKLFDKQHIGRLSGYGHDARR